jgi:hypothetical protein
MQSINKMKKLILLAVCLFPLALFAQDDVFGKTETPNFVMPSQFPLKDGKVVYEKIDTIKDLTKQQIYTVSKKWIADKFVSAKAVTQADNETSGQIIGKGFGKIIFDDEAVVVKYMGVKFSVQIDAKDGRYRIRFYDLYTHQEAFGQYVPESDTAFEKNVGFLLNPKRPKQNEKKIAAINKINTYFYNLMNDYKNAVTNSKKDDF